MVQSRPWKASCDPHLLIVVTDDGSNTLLDQRSGVTFHSESGAATETRHVYLRNSNVENRLRQGQPTTVLELGFGAAMGCLLTAAAARFTKTQVQYLGIDCRFLPTQLLRELELHRGGVAATWVEEFLHAYTDGLALLAKSRQGEFSWGSTRVRMHQCDASRLEDLGAALGENCFDAIYFDPFAPAASPALWNVALLRLLRQHLAVDGRLVTYCVNRTVRQLMRDAGFRTRRVPGPPGGKREVLIAEFGP